MAVRGDHIADTMFDFDSFLSPA